MALKFWRSLWRRWIPVSFLMVLLGAIALGYYHGQRVGASEPRHPYPATDITTLQPVAFGSLIPGQANSSPSNGREDLEAVSISTTPSHTPREDIIPADPTNYGTRYLTDVYGNPATYPLIVVIHETVGSASSAINLFRTPHPRDADQVSYHSLIRRDGSIVHLVHPQMRAFGAGNSVFVGPNGAEAVRTNAAFPPSVNNFAYHTSLESPSDGRGNQRGHSGYTEAQYQSLAWLVARLPVPDDRITTHQAVDRSGTRRDPRSFDRDRFLTLLQAYPRSFENFASPA